MISLLLKAFDIFVCNLFFFSYKYISFKEKTILIDVINNYIVMTGIAAYINVYRFSRAEKLSRSNS